MHTVNGHTCLFDHQIPPINSRSSISTGSSLSSIGWRLARPWAISPVFFLLWPFRFLSFLPFVWSKSIFFFCIFWEQLLSREFCLCAFIWSTVQVGSCLVLKTDRLAVQAIGPPWVGCLVFFFEPPFVFCAYCLRCFCLSVEFGFLSPLHFLLPLPGVHADSDIFCTFADLHLFEVAILLEDTKLVSNFVGFHLIHFEILLLDF